MSINAVHQWFFRVDQLFKLVKLFRLYSVFYIGKGVKQLDFKHSQLERQKARVFPQMEVVNFRDFTEDWHKKAVSAMETARGIDSETKRFVFETIKSLLALYIKNLRFPQ